MSIPVLRLAWIARDHEDTNGLECLSCYAKLGCSAGFDWKNGKYAWKFCPMCGIGFEALSDTPSNRQGVRTRDLVPYSPLQYQMMQLQVRMADFGWPDIEDREYPWVHATSNHCMGFGPDDDDGHYPEVWIHDVVNTPGAVINFVVLKSNYRHLVSQLGVRPFVQTMIGVRIIIGTTEDLRNHANVEHYKHPYRVWQVTELDYINLDRELVA
jgi:hypothetical protein